MDRSCLQYSLTDAEREHFNENGYLIIKNAVDADKVVQYTDVINKLYKNESGFYFLNTFVQKGFLEVIDNPKILPKVWGILGWNIYLQHSHLSATPF